MKRPFNSFLAPKLEEFVLSRQAANRWNTSYNKELHRFDNYIAVNYPDAKILTDEMTSWCNQRLTEKGYSCRTRTAAIWNFIDYARIQKWCDVERRRDLSREASIYVPHYFTSEELSLFFNECDCHFLDLSNRQKSRSNMLNRLEVPVFFRLLLSSGMRTCEARWLKCSDVDFSTGVIEIEKSKGVDQHRVVLHETMLSILQDYNNAMSKLMPGRVHLFPDRNDCSHKPEWESHHFRNIWYKISNERACPYDLRSYYAVANITRWENHGYELSGKLLFLSRSMGHKNIQSTFGYFHITPMLTDKLKRNTEKNFNSILPKLPTDEKE
ncbi:tyrosine-type recombinase/integrase [Bacteroides sp. 51]|uniref:tyrosine-type recombinase/integrase n=1 Tax=Bacteroides sp. 51 TaxID=2302938 RepID=UPI0013D139BC|nr:tyrosine-type recombinase/integrase [Bacteroides sp. 51]NDV84946.1 integrase [Bacteroides sp. 51]